MRPQRERERARSAPTGVGSARSQFLHPGQPRAGGDQKQRDRRPLDGLKHVDRPRQKRYPKTIAKSGGSIDSRGSTCNAHAMEHRALIERAVALSKAGMDRGDGGPFGAVVARQGEVIAESWNRVLSNCDPTAHAEIEALRAAAKYLDSFSLQGCVLYSSCEPCPMCLAAACWARIEHVYFANTRADAAAIGFDDQFFYDELSKPARERSLPTTRLDVPDAGLAMRAWHEDASKICY